jgi:hypothetical protein
MHISRRETPAVRALTSSRNRRFESVVWLGDPASDVVTVSPPSSRATICVPRPPAPARVSLGLVAPGSRGTALAVAGFPLVQVEEAAA